MTGAFITPARLAASWKSPCEVPPSPNTANTTPGTCFSFRPHASPTACGSWPAWSRYLTIGGIDADDTPSRLAAAARAASFISRLSGLGALDDHLFRLVGAGQDAEDGVARKSHPVVLPVPIRRTVLRGVVLHLALEPAHEVRQRGSRRNVRLLVQWGQLG